MLADKQPIKGVDKMKIAICDDEKIFVDRIKKLLDVPDAEVYSFSTGEELLASGIEFDALFLDIDMPGINGFEVAKIINLRNKRAVFSFVTVHESLSVQGYDYQPYRYILKQVPDTVVARKLRETIDEAVRRNGTLEIMKNGSKTIIRISDIECIESVGHYLKIFVSGEWIEWKKSFKDVEIEFEKYNIIRCHKGYMVNMKYVKSISRKEIVFYSGNKIPTGRSYYDSVDNKYKNYILSI